MVDQFWENIMKTWITKTIVVSACVLGIAGCASPVDRIAEKPHCHTDRGRNAYCTKDPAPSIAKDDEAKSFASVPEALTVYVVRYWGRRTSSVGHFCGMVAQRWRLFQTP
jgi:hypothetical protein